MSRKRKNHDKKQQRSSRSDSSVAAEQPTLSEIVANNPEHRQELREMMTTSYHFSGPLPPPALLRQYDDIIPGFSHTLLENWKDQTEHRMDLESKVIDSGVLMAKWGLAAAFTLGMTGIIAATIMATSGAEIPAATVGGISLAGLTGSFIYGTRIASQERERKQNQMRRVQEE